MDSFKHMTKEQFISSGLTNDQRLAYLKSWHEFVVGKAKLCTEALGKCTAGVSNVANTGDNTVSVTYYKGAKGTAAVCPVTPTDDNYGIRSIVSDKPSTGGNDKDAGRTYTIQYGEKNNSLSFTLSRGLQGADGAMGDGWGTFDRYRRKLINPGVTGFSASGKGFSPSVTGVKGGITGISLSFCGASFAFGGLYRGHNGVECDNKAKWDKLHNTFSKLGASKTENILSQNKVSVSEVVEANLKEGTTLVGNNLGGMRMEMLGTSSNLEKALLDTLT